MSVNSLTVNPELDQARASLEKYFFIAPSECPYNLPGRAAYKQARFELIPGRLMGLFLDSGYRRNGNCLYTMRCRECDACVPIKIDPQEFVPSRSQKRVISKNRDLEVEIAPLAMTTENLELCQRFLDYRYPNPGISAREYYTGFFINSICDTYEVRYRAGKRLVGVGIIDSSTDWLNCVYFYFDPDCEKRSPGRYNILYLLDFCRQHRIGSLYLGYWIKEIKAMSYKAAFKPHYLLRDGRWRRVMKGVN